MRRNMRELWYDRLHKGFVLTSVGVTLVATMFVGIQVYDYLMVVRPLQKQLQQERERELLKEGMAIANTN